MMVKFDWTPRARSAASALFAIVVGWGTWHHLAAERRRFEARGDMADAVVARRYLPAGRPLSPSDVERRRLPRAFVEPGALAAADELSSARTRVALPRGAQLTRATVELAGARTGLAWSLGPGERALGLRLPPERAAGGQIAPGDRVDVMAVPRRQGAAAVVLARRLRVGAVGDRLWDPATAPAPPVNATPADSLLVTLLMPPETAMALAAAAEQNAIVLALASPLGDAAPGRP